MKSFIAVSVLAVSSFAFASTTPVPCHPTPTNPYCGLQAQTLPVADLMQSGLVKFGR